MESFDNAQGATKNDIIRFAKEHFGAVPEYLWQKFPEFFVFRIADNKKWYAVIGAAERFKLGLDGAGKADVLVVKCDPQAREILLHEKGVIPAYHMNKERWIGVLLDGSCRKDLAFGLLEESFNTVKQKARVK